MGIKNNRPSQVGLWRTKSPSQPLVSNNQSFELKYIFPSGRQALSFSLCKLGIGRASRIAFPEWSSHCVVGAIAAYGTPIPMTEVVKNGMHVDAVLAYEQWGWPIADEVMGQLKDRFKGSIFILDMVDSAHFKVNKKNGESGFKAFIQLTSLSKLLGLGGGGLVSVDGKYLEFCPQAESEEILSVFGKKGIIPEEPSGFIRHILKENIAALDPNLKKWLTKNDLLAAIESERTARQRNLKILLNSLLSVDWPDWMKKIIREGSGPGIAPLFRGCPDEILLKTRGSLFRDYGLETSIYHFNWSGNPLEPEYEKCLAFPVHGMVVNIEEILESIKL